MQTPDWKSSWAYWYTSTRVVPDKPVRFQYNFQIRKLSRTNRYASTQNHFRESSKRSLYSLNTNPHPKAKSDNPVRFYAKSFPRVKRAIPVLSQYKSSFGSQAGHTGTL